MFDLLVAGEINPDLILSGDVVPRFHQIEQRVDEARLNIGSSAAILACGASRLGLSTALIGVCGDDLFGRSMLDELAKHGVDVANAIVRPGEPTGLSVILNRGEDRAILTFLGLIPELRAVDVTDELLGEARHLHVASYFLQTALRPHLAALFRRARALGLTTSLDTNYDPTGTWEGLDPVLPHTNILLPNAREAMAISGAPNVEEAVTQLAARVETLVVKLGLHGALAVRGSDRAQASSPPVPVVDTVGAGDSFDAGFLYGHLSQWSLLRSLQLACACGGLSTRMAGGTDGQPTIDEALQYVPG